jgi:hypothetical protein
MALACYLHCPGGPLHLDVGLLSRFPCPVLVVVVVWQLSLLQFPTGVGPDTQTPLSFVKVPPDAVHCCSEGDAATAAVVPKANNDTDPSNKKAVRDIVLLPQLYADNRARKNSGHEWTTSRIRVRTTLEDMAHQLI